MRAGAWLVLWAAAASLGCETGRGSGEGKLVAERLPESPRAKETVERARKQFRAALPPAQADFVESKGGMLRPHVPERPKRKPQADLLWPSRSSAAFKLSDPPSGVSIEVALANARRVEGEWSAGYLVYRDALGDGADLLRRAFDQGSEDYVLFAKAPSAPEVAYEVSLGERVAGVRLVSDTFELLDKGGTPRLRATPPRLLDAAGRWHAARVTVERCRADTSLAPPWGRKVTDPKGRRCTVRMSWKGASVQYPALLDPPWDRTQFDMATDREDHSSTLLASGFVLVAGGRNTTTPSLNSAELFNPAGGGSWSPAGNLLGARYRHTEVRLTDGRVLIAGGHATGGATPAGLATVELYDPAANSFSAARDMGSARGYHTATLLASCRVLIAGGLNSGAPVGQGEIYTPNLGPGTFANTTNAMINPRSHHAAVLMTAGAQTGQVLLVGGYDGTTTFFNTAERYNPASNRFESIAATTMRRRVLHTASMIDLAGTPAVLIAGGGDETNFSGGATASTSELYDPASSNFASTGNFVNAHSHNRAIVLGSGRVLLTGSTGPVAAPGNLTSELFDTSVRTWKVTGDLNDSRSGTHSMTLIGGGRVLVAGGGSGGNSLRSAELYDPLANGVACNGPADCASGLCVDTRTARGRICCADQCCTGTATVNCADVDPCTNDACFPALGCRNVNVNHCSLPAQQAACAISAGCRHDADGDGLSDEWETNGGIDFNCDGTYDPSERVLTNFDPTFPNGTANPNPSADPAVKDVFLKYDFMQLSDQLSGGLPVSCTVDSTDTNTPQGSSNCDFDQYCIGGVCRGHSDGPDPIAVQRVVDALRNHSPPVRLHVHPTHAVLNHARVISYGPPVSPACVTAGARKSVDFYTLKTANLPTNLSLFTHYAVFAHLHTCDTDGAGGNLCGAAACANPDTGRNPFYGESGLAEQPGNDVVVSLGQFQDLAFPLDCSTVLGCTALAGTIMHELGHNLGLEHGGPLFIGGAPAPNEVRVNYKPNYISVMSYSFQFRGIETAGAIGSTTPVGAPRIDYSEFVPVTPNIVDETNLDESLGLALGRNDISYTFCSLGQTPIPGQNASSCTPTTCTDFNCDSAITTLPGVDVNNDPLGGGTLGGDRHQPRADWPDLFFGYQCFPSTFADGVAPGSGRHRSSGEVTARQALDQHLLYPIKRVNVDVRPTCSTNFITIEPSPVPVILYGAKDFDIENVDQKSIRLQGAAPTSITVGDPNKDKRKDLLLEWSSGALKPTQSLKAVQLRGALKSSQAFLSIQPVKVYDTLANARCN